MKNETYSKIRSHVFRCVFSGRGRMYHLLDNLLLLFTHKKSDILTSEDGQAMKRPTSTRINYCLSSKSADRELIHFKMTSSQLLYKVFILLFKSISMQVHFEHAKT